MKRFIPLILFVLLVAAMGWRLTRPDTRYVPSKLVGQQVPALQLPAMLPDRPGVTLPAGEGPRLVNMFGSWCVPCIAEAPMLSALASRGVKIDGIAVRDTPQEVTRFLARNGDPFARIGSDPESRAQIAFGGSGVPETFVVDGRGVIRYHHVGPIEEADVTRIMAELEKAK